MYTLQSLSGHLDEICKADDVRNLPNFPVGKQLEITEERLSNDFLRQLPFGDYLVRSADTGWRNVSAEELKKECLFCFTPVIVPGISRLTLPR